MTKRHKTLELLVGRSTIKGIAKSGNWKVEYENGVYSVYHWDTLVLRINSMGYDVVYGESKSDADGINAMLDWFGHSDRYTYRPVNGGFMQVS